MCRQNLVYNPILSFKKKEEQYDQLISSKEERVTKTRPNFGNTISNLVDPDKEEVEDLKIWQHRNLSMPKLKPNKLHPIDSSDSKDIDLKKSILLPIQEESEQNFKILLRNPIYNISQLIKEPAKIIEGFNRSNHSKSRIAVRAKAHNLEKSMSSVQYALNINSTSDKEIADKTIQMAVSKTNLNSNLLPLFGRHKNSLPDYLQPPDPVRFEEIREKNLIKEVRLEFKRLK